MQKQKQKTNPPDKNSGISQKPVKSLEESSQTLEEVDKLLAEADREIQKKKQERKPKNRGEEGGGEGCWC